MVRPVDPAMARNLADRIERLPDHVNDPLQMPFVQEALRGAFEQLRSDRDLLAQQAELNEDPRKAERYRQPVESIPLPDDVKRALEEGFERDESGVFEEIERDAAEIGEWLKDHRHPRESERFREYLKFVCGQAVAGWSGVEVRPGVFKLDLSLWEAEAAEPLCNYLRELADEMATEPAASEADSQGAATCSMRFDGGHWHITFDNEKGFVDESKGAKYVSVLLERPGKGMPCHVLHTSTEASLKANDPVISRNDACEELSFLRDELAELRGQWEERPHEILPEDRETEQGLLSRARVLTGLSGQPRQKESAGTARTAVLKAVKRFQAACRKKGLHAFVDHLESKLDMGSTPVYNGSIEWEISHVMPNVTL